ncbi:MAG TPA: hypothetical protein VFX58_09470 [Chitinophagaceae bacterium]|nr:hypothetical protein [Chitinophagaceae bacterium]
MKKWLIILAAALVFSDELPGQSRKFRDMIGQWKIAGEQNAGVSLQVIDSATMLLTYNGETRPITNIKFDFSKSPYWFDFSAAGPGATWHVKSLLEIGDRVMKWQIFVDEERSPYFTASKGELLYLKRSTDPAPLTAQSNSN